MAYTTTQLYDAYIESIRRKDKKNNVYIVPMTSIDEDKNAFYPNASYKTDVVMRNVYIDGRPLKAYSVTGPLILSLKEGRYKLRIDYVVDRELGISIQAKVGKSPYHKLSTAAHDARLSTKGSKEMTVTVGSLGETYVMLKTQINSKWKSQQTSTGGTWWYPDGCTYSLQLVQTDLRTIERMCSFWMQGKKTYSYPAVDHDALIEVLADQARDLAKAGNAAYAARQQAQAKTSTTSKPTTTASKTTTTASTAKPVFQKIPSTNGTYAGFTVNGKRHGHGMYKWNSGDIYDGEWKDDKRTGHGIYYYANGDKHVGEYVNGKRNGPGVYTFANGKVKRGTWKDDKYIG